MKAALLTLLISSTAWAAAPCPANPLSALGGTWTFNIQLGSLEGSPIVSYGLAGTFQASIGADRSGQPTGSLRINATSQNNFSATRLENDIGSFQINADCTGGTLTFNLSSRPSQFDFWFFNGNQSMNLVGTVDFLPMVGTAHSGPAGCPAGLTNAQTLFSGPFAFRLRGLYWSFGDPVSPTHVSAGRLVAANGQLRITASSVVGSTSSVARLEQGGGSYHVYPDCSGGTLDFHLGSRPVQLEFYFRAGFEQIDVISTSGPAVFGILSRAPAAGCPANPLSVLAGTWTYNTQALWNLDRRHQYAAAGQFRASAGIDRAGAAVGLLALDTTSVQIDSITRGETDAGRYQIFDDCTGGTLTFNLSSYPQQYDFWFHNGGIYFVSTLGGAPLIGSAGPGASACPVGVSPLSLLTGPWSFRVQNMDSDGFVLGPWMSQAGMMTGSIGLDRAANPIGVLAITATTQLIFLPGSGVSRLASHTGRWTVNADCSGGTLTFNQASAPVQYEFYFRAGFNEFDAIGTVGRTPLTWGLFSR